MRGDFGMVPMSARHLSQSAVKVLFWMCVTMRKRDHKCWWTQKGIADVCSMSRTTVRKAEAELLKAGFIEFVEEGKRVSGVFVIDPTPETLKDTFGDQKLVSTDSGHERELVTGDQKMVTNCTDSDHKPEQNQRNIPKQERASRREVEQQPVRECDDVSSPSRPTPTCPHCNESVSYLHSIPGRGGEMGCRQCAEKYRAA